jgi:hypothetical protein
MSHFLLYFPLISFLSFLSILFPKEHKKPTFYYFIFFLVNFAFIILMKQTRYKPIPCMQLAFDRIPDEILVHILAQPILNLSTLSAVMHVSQRLYQLVMRVLVHYRLPAIEMALSIDQEGKSKVTNRFEFSHFCNMTLHAVFVNVQPIPKRYYTNKAYPVVRLMSMEDYYMHPVSQLHSEIKSSSSSFTIVQPVDEKTLGIKRTWSSDSIQQPVAMATDSNTKVQNYKLQAQKEGLHILQVTPLLFQPNMSSWKMTYQISNKEKHEYYLTPINICIKLEELIRFEHKVIKKAPMNKMINWLYRLK